MVQLPAYLKLSPKEINQKFNNIERLEKDRISKSLQSQQESQFTLINALHPSNRSKNRYSNVLPYDHTRVKISDYQKQSSNSTQDYINANHIELDQTHQYITTQAPILNTLTDFWQMIYQKSDRGEIVDIVMLTPLVEKGIEKSSKYWINDIGKRFKVSNDGSYQTDIVIECLNKNKIHNYLNLTEICLKVYDHTTNQLISSKRISHWHIINWGDFNKPQDWISIYELSKNIRQTLKSPDSANPLFIHCSAGVGRSGTFIVLDYLFNQPLDILLNDQDIIENTVLRLREQRLMMVQSPIQYQYLYDTIKDYILNNLSHKQKT
ncbi:hypothetical protein WICMUC_005623 [Wickerhamomyces mucosus]|uniref:Protein-tyrosine-phosphatase n=1 Tax=Wickerhamomyces mucosus TaxID=1378264 RepID=A0A9P8P8C7_9ASCO|nr:hypothetical protein WICMUC_005623 [Wickerhamomyces mucosus]